MCRILNDFGNGTPKMGEYYWDKKDTVEDCRGVSISFLNKKGYFSEPCYMSGVVFWTNSFGEEIGSIGIVVSTLEGENYVRFNYTVTDRNPGEKKPIMTMRFN